ncbi:MAG: DUF2892 domain-containing protein [Bacteroidia bacterium]|nr:DUF2892 domain-containing protein [Bacteroidia bacterium]
MKLTQNVGGIDKYLRLIVGAALVIVGILYSQGWWLAIPGAVIFLSGLVGRCLLYYPFGISTCPAKKA